MGTRLELPGGAWADLREPAQVPERLRRPVLRLAVGLGPTVKAMQQRDTDDGGMSADEVDRFAELNDVAVVALVGAWSFEAPVSLDAVLDLPGDVYDALRAAVAPLITPMLPNFDPDPDPESPTTPSSV